MKKIELKHITQPDKESHYIKQRMYCLFLGNGHREYFTNYKDAKKYLADTNRFLNIKLHQSNFYYSYIFTEYRNIWFYFEGRSPSQRKDHMGIERKITLLFNQDDKVLNRIARKTYRSNDNVFAFKYLLLIIDNLYEVLELIKNVSYATSFL